MEFLVCVMKSLPSIVFFIMSNLNGRTRDESLHYFLEVTNVQLETA